MKFINISVLVIIALFSIGASTSTTLNNSEIEERLDSIETVSYHFDCDFWEYDTEEVYDNSWSTRSLFPYDHDALNFNEFTILKLDTTTCAATYPVKNTLYSPFKSRGKTRWHNGLDIRLKTGDKVTAAFDGVVRYSGYNDGGFGNLIIIRHTNGLETYYAHLSRRKVSANDTIKAGQIIGLGGSTVRSNGPHLHFEVRLEDQPINPAVIFDTETYELKTDVITLCPEIFAPGKGTNV